MKILFLITILLNIFCNSLLAQTPKGRKNKCTTCSDHVDAKPGQFKKGEFFFSWGYNRAAFSKSDIAFSGNGVDFTLKDVIAKDRPTPFNFNDYFIAITIPQFVMSGGYFFRNNWSISLGTDHMKYVMKAEQDVIINGTIDSTNTTTYNGVYNNQTLKIQPNFLRYEHTNGLNYINTGLEHYSVLWDAKNGPGKFTFVQGLSLSMLYPRSDVDLFDVEGTNVFHVAGWGAALHLGFRFNILKNLYLFWNNKAGYIDLPDVLCQINKYKAKQHFFFYQAAVSIGYNWRF